VWFIKTNQNLGNFGPRLQCLDIGYLHLKIRLSLSFVQIYTSWTFFSISYNLYDPRSAFAVRFRADGEETLS